MSKKGTIKSEEMLYEGFIFDVKQRKVESPFGGELTRDVVLKNEVVNILAIDKYRNVLVTHEFRAGVNEVTYGFPAGIIDPGEDPITAALRELQEETGYIGKNAREILQVASSEGFTNELTHSIVIDIDENNRTETNFDDGELVFTEKVPFDELLEMIKTGKIKSGQCISTALGYHTFR